MFLKFRQGAHPIFTGFSEVVHPLVVKDDPTLEPHPTHHSPLSEIVLPQVLEIDPTREPHPTHHSPLTLSEVLRPQVVDIDPKQGPHLTHHSPFSEIIHPMMVEIDPTQEPHPTHHSPLSLRSYIHRWWRLIPHKSFTQLITHLSLWDRTFTGGGDWSHTRVSPNSSLTSLSEIVCQQMVEIDPTQKPHPTCHSSLSEVVQPQVVEIDPIQEPHPTFTHLCLRSYVHRWWRLIPHRSAATARRITMTLRRVVHVLLVIGR